MNWIKENTFLSCLIGVVLAGLVGLAVLVGNTAGNSVAAYEQYLQLTQTLQSLQNRSPFPSEANLKRASELKEKYKAQLVELKEEISKLQVPLEKTITPQQFQDDLRAAVNDVTSRAQLAKIKLPENFYLGFNEYSTRPPTQEAAPSLARQLSFIKKIVDNLIGLSPENPGVISIDSIDRPPLAEEAPAAPNSGLAAAGAVQQLASRDTPKVSKIPFLISYTTEPGKFRIGLNNFLDSKFFVIIRSLTIRNSQQQGPLIDSEKSDSSQASSNITDIFNPNPAGQESPDNKTTLNVILGREVLQINAVLEMVDFHLPPEAQK